MKNQDLSRQFEDRSNDWLAGERKRERKALLFDSSESIMVKEFHEDHCAVQSSKEAHLKTCANKQEQDFEKLGAFLTSKKAVLIGPILFFTALFFEILTALTDIQFIPLIVIAIVVFIIVKNIRRKK